MTSESTGKSQAHNNMPPYYVLAYIMKMNDELQATEIKTKEMYQTEIQDLEAEVADLKNKSLRDDIFKHLYNFGILVNISSKNIIRLRLNLLVKKSECNIFLHSLIKSYEKWDAFASVNG